jgi:hypothetical protein
VIPGVFRDVFLRSGRPSVRVAQQASGVRVIWVTWTAEPGYLAERGVN